MLRSKSEAAAKRIEKERIVKTPKEENTEENDSVRDAIEETEDSRLENSTSSATPSNQSGEHAPIYAALALNHRSPSGISGPTSRAVIHPV